MTPPKSSDDLRRLGRAISAVHYLTGGNMTHTPGYGALIALGMVNVLKRLDFSAEEIAAAESYRDQLAESGRFLTFAGGGPLIGTRLREDENDRAALPQLAWDQVSSGLDGREAVFELHASGGLEAWRRRLAAWFERYTELANGVHGFVQVDLPHLDLSSLQELPAPPRRMPQSTPRQ